MPVKHGPQTSEIEVNGLFLYIDGEQYSGSGTSVPNSSPTPGATATLINGATWNGSAFYFDGVDDRIRLSYSAPTQNFCYNLWAMPLVDHQIDNESYSVTGTSGQFYVVRSSNRSATGGGVGISLGTNGVSVYEHGSGYMPCLLAYEAEISSSQFTNICLNYVNQTGFLYINGSFVRQGLPSTRDTSYMDGSDLGGGTYGEWNGYLSIAQYYNRALTENEITQNYVALKPRFEL